MALSRNQKFLDEFEHREDFSGRYPGPASIGRGRSNGAESINDW